MDGACVFDPDGICEICGQPRTHEYTVGQSLDESYHQLVCKFCGHTEKKKNTKLANLQTVKILHRLRLFLERISLNANIQKSLPFCGGLFSTKNKTPLPRFRGRRCSKGNHTNKFNLLFDLKLSLSAMHQSLGALAVCSVSCLTPLAAVKTTSTGPLMEGSAKETASPLITTGSTA